ncbi:hypothetical protein IFM89_013956 [Coptis chinensis]|uniref:N-acetyltransferase domain-containing protein n=1 Tax=Coptis chinensis TaxID=261450 RepID=A0A835HHD9_9MAGN|nr:hypothetical protein IFM89_013956 [Coptis chinensis]
MQACNLLCLPENYPMKDYFDIILSWPQLSYVAEDYGGKIVGYVLVILYEDEDDEEDDDDLLYEDEDGEEDYDDDLLYEDEDDEEEEEEEEKKKEGEEEEEEEEEGSGCRLQGYIQSLAVLRTHRKLGLATKLMTVAQNAMEQVYSVEKVALHCRTNNSPALNLYTKKFGYEICKTEEHGEDAYYYMVRSLVTPQKAHWGDSHPLYRLCELMISVANKSVQSLFPSGLRRLVVENYQIHRLMWRF